MSRYYEITDGNLHVGWASEDYMFTKMDERVLKGEANFNFHVCDRDAVDVAPVKHGYWLRPKGKEYGVCSNCGMNRVDLLGGDEHNYCEVCGAKMEGVKEI